MDTQPLDDETDLDTTRVPLTDEVHERLIAMVMDGSLAPGAPLRVLSLAAQLGVSQTPVRESLSRLAGSGLVERSPMRGYRVGPLLDADALADLIRVRVLIECEMVASALGSPELDSKLAANVQQTREVSIGPSYDEYREYLELSSRFHELIAEASGSYFLRVAFDALPVHLQRFRLFGPEGVDDSEVSISEHDEVRQAIASGDPAQAREAMRSHILGVEARSRVQ